MNEWAKKGLASERQAVWDGDKIPDKKRSLFHLLLFRRLQSRQSIWQLEAIVRPPSTHGVI